jgi:Na+-transporting methylmalonyl-CoA/oxaloacetate decarboxylase beta subunit
VALLGAVLTGVLAFVFAVPGGMLVTKLLEKIRKPGTNQDTMQ